jgi:hypothetical protein
VCLFSIPWQVEGCCQLKGCFVDRQAMIPGPEVQGVALGLAIRLETVKEVFAEVDRHGAATAISFVEGTATT